MARWRRRAAVEPFDTLYQRCRRCGHLNEIATTPRGGRYAPHLSTATVVNPYTSHYPQYPSGETAGCKFCGSTDW